MKIRKGDEVKIIKGKDKGKSGNVEKVIGMDKVVVAGANMYKKFKKAKTQTQKSEIISIVKPLPIASVRLICPKCHTPTRVGYGMEEGKKIRKCKKCDQII